METTNPRNGRSRGIASALTETGTANTTIEGAAIAATAQLRAVEKHPTTTKYPLREATLEVTRVGGEAEAAMMTAVTHVVTEMATTIAEEEAGVAPAPDPVRLTALVALAMTATIETVATALTDTLEINGAEGTTTGIHHPSVRPLHNLLKMNGIAALSLSSSSPPASELAS